MRENNDMEILMQQKMEAFRLEPSPSDWQAIYEQLHPKKRRRFFWWWFPLAAGISLFGAYWLFNTDQESSVPKIAGIEQKISAPDENIETRINPSTLKETTPGSPLTTNPGNESNGIEQPKETARKNTDLGSADIAEKRNPESKNTGSAIRLKDENDDRSPGNDNQPIASFETETNIRESVAPETTDQSAAPTETTKEAATETTITSQPKEAATETIGPIQPKEPETTVRESKKSIPNLSDHKQKGWYLGVYGNIGVNIPTQPVSMAKSADFTSLPATSSSYSSTRNADKNGLHVALGLALERKMKKMSFTTGLGLQQNTWASGITVYKDSISTAGFYSRSVVSQNTINYRHLAIEIPLVLNFRIAGKKSSSYWINAGLNNAISLKLNKRTDAPIAGNILDNMPSDPTSYQPQIRFGLMYENTRQRSHWQASPFIQYGLSNMNRSGNPDIRLLHFGISGRYYFKRL